MVEKYAAQGNVIVEGILIASSYGVIGELLKRHAPNALVLFLSTAVDECVRRVRARRKARGDRRKFDPTNLIAKHATIERIKQKIDAAGIVPTRIASSDDAPSIIIKLLTADKGGLFNGKKQARALSGR